MGVDGGKRMPYLGTVRKVNEAAQAMAKKRWAGKTKAERMATSRHAAEARSRKAAERRAAREAQTNDGEGAGA